jgi:hypothetical protein
LGGTECSSPLYPGLIGTTVPAFMLAHNTSVKTNQPLFEAEFRTAIKNDTLLIRPYVGTIHNVLDGTNRSAGPDPSVGNSWSAVTSGTGWSVARPCLLPDSASAAYRDQEDDRLHGATVTLIHPLGEGALNLSYDYRSDATTVASGNPNVPFDGTIVSASGYLVSIPTTLARNFDWSATYAVPLTTRLNLFVGDYYTDWNLDYGTLANIDNFITGSAIRKIGSSDRTFLHDDPHVGLTWHPQPDTSYRVSPAARSPRRTRN